LLIVDENIFISQCHNHSSLDTEGLR
jgi:hypothetical protein